MKLLLYYHTGSRNHGCEAIVKSFCNLFKYDEILLYSYDIEADKQFGLETYVKLKAYSSRKKYSIGERVKIRLHLYQEGQECFSEMLQENNIDCAIAIGGDSYCYNGQPGELAYLNKEWNKKKIKTILLGCSINESVIAQKRVQKDLKKYTMILARESLTYTSLQKYGVMNCCLFPDTAFLLSTDVNNIELDEKHEYVGINLGPLIKKGEKKKGIVLSNYINLIKYILDTTDYHILLIPHVLVEWDNDIDVLNILYNSYGSTNRVHLVSEQNCTVLKGYVSKCKYMICARTHVSIAAYSLSIPTFVVGYSVKSKGLAVDLFGTDTNYVISSSTINSDRELIEAFQWIERNEKKITIQLNKMIKEYRKKLLELPVFMKQVIEANIGVIK